jgi:tetratricopeptide (TPR) repeat protein
MARDIGIPKGPSDPQVLLSFLGIGIMAILIFRLYKRTPILSFMGMWFFIFLFPQSGIFPINAFIADHFLYIPAIGFFFILSYLLDKICAKKIFNLVMLTVVLVLSCLTIWQNTFWSEPVRFYKRIIKFSPRSFAAYNNLGQVYGDRQDFVEAERLYKKALELNSKLVEGYNNLAALYFKLKNYQQAIEQLDNISQVRPDFKPAELHNNMGTIYAAKGDFASAIREYNKALELDPSLLLVHYNLARAYLSINNPKEAIGELEKSLAISSSLLSFENNKGPTLKEYQEVFKIEEPNCSVFNALGILYSKHGLWDHAERAFNAAINLNPNEADLYFNLGGLYWRQGLYKQARRQWKKALKVNPRHPHAKEWLMRKPPK